MKVIRQKWPYAILIAVTAIALLTDYGARDGAVAQDTEKETQTDDGEAQSAETEADILITPRKASCRCGRLRVAYNGPDPERITLCHCNSCQMRTGTAFSIQARLPREHVKINGKSTEWTFPDDLQEKPDYRSCDSGGATFHFCPTCGSTVYWDIHAAPEVVGIAIGTLTDPTFPAPKISGFEAYAHPWAMKPAELPILRAEYDKLK
jgi:hypothetical protein